MPRIITPKTILAFAALATGAACLDSEFAVSKEAEGQCHVQNEPVFNRAAAKLQAAYHNTSFSKGSLFVSRCGHIIVTTRSGLKKRAELTSLYARVGSPTWQIGVAAREAKYEGGKTYRNTTMFEYNSRNGRKVTRGELQDMNRTLNQLARATGGKGSSSVDIDAELQGAASLERATNRLKRTAVAAMETVAEGARRGGAIVGTYSCSMKCERLGGDQAKASVTLQNISGAQADNYVSMNGTAICRKSFGKNWSMPTFFPGIECKLR